MMSLSFSAMRAAFSHSHTSKSSFKAAETIKGQSSFKGPQDLKAQKQPQRQPEQKSDCIGKHQSFFPQDMHRRLADMKGQLADIKGEASPQYEECGPDSIHDRRSARERSEDSHRFQPPPAYHANGSFAARAAQRFSFGDEDD